MDSLVIDWVMKAGIVPQGPLAEDSEISLTLSHDKMKTSSVNQEVGFHQTLTVC